MYFDWGLAVRYLPLLVQGLLTTLKISAIVITLGLVLGIFVAAGRLSKDPKISKPVAAYIEIFRGTQALGKDQIDSADVLGLSYFHKMCYVIVPQAFRMVIPVLLSLSISLFKDTSLVSTLGVGDLMYQGRVVATQTYRPIEILTSVAAIYFLIAFPVSVLTRRLELRLARAFR